MIDMTPATWACDRLEGIAYRYIQNKRGNTANHLIGAVKLAIRWGASADQISDRVKHVCQFAYQPDPQRLSDLQHIVDFAL
jgi:hypothetical protein